MQEKIKTLDDVIACVIKKQSLYCPTSTCFAKPKPAAFIINLSAIILYGLIKHGLYVYKKKGKA